MHPSQSKSQLLGQFLARRVDLAVGVVHFVVLHHLFMVTTKKGRPLFVRKKVNPRQNPGYAYVPDFFFSRIPPTASVPLENKAYIRTMPMESVGLQRHHCTPPSPVFYLQPHWLPFCV